MNLKSGKVFTIKFVWTGPSSYEKIIYRAAVSQRLRNSAVCVKKLPPGVREQDAECDVRIGAEVIDRSSVWRGAA